jgi:hypothetical protein
VSFTPSGGIRWQVGTTLAAIMAAKIAFNAYLVLILTAHLVVVASPQLPRRILDSIVLPVVDVDDWDFGPREAARLIRECDAVIKTVLCGLKERNIYAQVDTPEGGVLYAGEDEAGEVF